MHFVTLALPGNPDGALAVLDHDRVLVLERPAPVTMIELVRGGSASLAQCAAQTTAMRASGKWQPLAGQSLLAPLPRPVRNVFCVGRNYLDHVKEGVMAREQELSLPEVPQFFTKATHTVIGPGAAVRLDSAVTRRLDYEVELAVIIGRGGRDIAAADAMSHVFGYTIANDVTARDLQRRHDQWFKGKSLDTTLPMGPCVVTADEIGDYRQLRLQMHVNGQLRQSATAAQMIFDIPTIIASLSAGMTLEPGDVIATGTPAGVGFAMKPPQYLAPGDQMLATIDGIGELANGIVAA